MVTISLCMIVKNEQAVLARCLDSVREAVDEIIIVDTGSEDTTKEIARRYTDKVLDFAWTDDFSAARNFSFRQAGMQYCLWLDADDVLLPDDLQKLLRLKETLEPEVDVVTMRYHTAFDEAGNPTFVYVRERLVRNTGEDLWRGAVHEAITPFGVVRHSDIAVTHRKEGKRDTDRNLRIFEKMISQGQAFSPREQFYYANELYYHARYDDAVRAYRQFLSGGQGWVENVLEACRFLAYCYYHLDDGERALGALLSSLRYAPPRAELCCDVGRHFLDRGRVQEAVFWYELALTRPRREEEGGFAQQECYGFLPCIQLCVCYDRLGDLVRAREYNERAAAFKPEDESVLHNRAYFAARLPEEA